MKDFGEKLSSPDRDLVFNMLDGNKPIDLLIPCVLKFFRNFHGAHIHLFHSDSPTGIQGNGAASGSDMSDSTFSFAELTSPGGLYEGVASDLQGDSVIDYTLDQDKSPRILIAVTGKSKFSHHGTNPPAVDLRVPIFSSLLTNPSAMRSTELNPFWTAQHIIKVPLRAHINNRVKLMPRYS